MSLVLVLALIIVHLTSNFQQVENKSAKANRDEVEIMDINSTTGDPPANKRNTS